MMHMGYLTKSDTRASGAHACGVWLLVQIFQVFRYKSWYLKCLAVILTLSSGPNLRSEYVPWHIACIFSITMELDVAICRVRNPISFCWVRGSGGGSQIPKTPANPSSERDTFYHGI